MLALLARESPQTVSAVASRLRLRLSLASQYLRTLEARGLLKVRRVARQAEYRAKAASDGERGLAQALQSAFRTDPAAVQPIFGLCTAFTHPRRIAIFRALRRRVLTWDELRRATRIPDLALWRHLKKLKARGFVTHRFGRYAATCPKGTVSRALAELASL
jgi:predicted ArsR family transcriptional regulator